MLQSKKHATTACVFEFRKFILTHEELSVSRESILFTCVEMLLLQFPKTVVPNRRSTDKFLEIPDLCMYKMKAK